MDNLKIAIIVPCFNEEVTIGKVVKEFSTTIPDANIYVYDNNSSDRTVNIARQAGAIIRTDKRQGKGYVIRRAFSDIDADIYLMVDGDDTYDPKSAPAMIKLLLDGQYDYVNGARIHNNNTAYRIGHAFGNALLTGAVSAVFGRQVKDMLSGYKALTKRFVKSFPISSSGFEIETELMVHALELGMPIAEINTFYKERPQGSVSKLSTFRDGFRILWKIIRLIESEKPLYFFGAISLLFSLTGIILGIPIFLEYLDSGLVPRFPTAILSGFLEVLSALSFVTGLILDLIQKYRNETKKLCYLGIQTRGNQLIGT